MWLFRITQTHDGGLKVWCPSLCATFRILLSFFRRALDTKWLEFSTAAMYVLFLSDTPEGWTVYNLTY